MLSLIYSFFVLIRYWSKLNIYTKPLLVTSAIVEAACWTSIIVLGKVLSSKGNKVLNSWNGRKWNTRRETGAMKRL